jgi:hypothetical protein
MPNNWLFVKDQHSIYISRTALYSVVVAGPGRARQQLAFEDERGVQQYQAEVAGRMAARGWILYAVDRQRRVGEQRTRPAPQERRAPLDLPGN